MSVLSPAQILPLPLERKAKRCRGWMEEGAPAAEGKQGLPCFKMSPGYDLIRCGKVTETKTTAFERGVYYTQFLRGGRMPCFLGPHRGSTKMASEVEEAREKRG